MAKNTYSKKVVKTANWTLLVYPEDYEKVIHNLNHWNTAKYLCMFHKGDPAVDTSDGVDEDYCPKDHFHFIVKTTNQSLNTTVSNKLDLDLRFIRKCNSIEAMEKYMCHLDETSKLLEKPEYDPDDICGSPSFVEHFRRTISKVYGVSDVDQGVRPLLAYISNHSADVTRSSLLIYAVEHGLTKSYRAYASTLIAEVNDVIRHRSSIHTSPTVSEILVSDTKELLRQEMEIQYKDFCSAVGLAYSCGEYTLSDLTALNHKYHFFNSVKRI